MKKLFTLMVLCLTCTFAFAQEVNHDSNKDYELCPVYTEACTSISQLNAQYEATVKAQELAGVYIERSSNFQFGAASTAVLGSLLTVIVSDGMRKHNYNNATAVTYAMATATAMASGALWLCGNANLQKAGLVLQGNGISYNF